MHLKISNFSPEEKLQMHGTKLFSYPQNTIFPKVSSCPQTITVKRIFQIYPDQPVRESLLIASITRMIAWAIYVYHFWPVNILRPEEPLFEKHSWLLSSTTFLFIFFCWSRCLTSRLSTAIRAVLIDRLAMIGQAEDRKSMIVVVYCGNTNRFDSLLETGEKSNRRRRDLLDPTSCSSLAAGKHLWVPKVVVFSPKLATHFAAYENLVPQITFSVQKVRECVEEREGEMLSAPLLKFWWPELVISFSSPPPMLHSQACFCVVLTNAKPVTIKWIKKAAPQLKWWIIEDLIPVIIT